MAGPASQAFSKAMTTFISSSEGKQLLQTEVASFLREESTSLKEGIVEDMKEEIQRAVKKEVDKRLRGELERVRGELKASMKEELDTLTTFGSAIPRFGRWL